MKFLTLLGAWCVIVPIKLVLITLAAVVAIIEMPVATWYSLDKILEDIHSSEGN